MTMRGRIVLLAVGAALVLAAAGCRALAPDIPFATLEAKYANAQSRFMDLPGGLRIHYRDQGSRTGPVVVMLHGYSASLHAWEPWVARLGGGYRIVTLDLPGHGLTRAPPSYAPSLAGYADLVDAVTQRLGLGAYVIVGNSMGGGVAWTLALRHPNRVRGLVLVDAIGPPDPAERSQPPLVFRLLDTPLGRVVLRNIDTRGLAERGLKSAYVDPALVTPALVDRYVELSRAPGHRSILLNGPDREGQAVRPEALRAIRIPTLILQGQADTVVPPATAQRLTGLIPGARLVTYPGVGHVPMEQVPDPSARDLRAFLEALDAPAGSFP